MAKTIGRQFQLGIAKEVTRGTWVTPLYWLPWVDLTLDEKQEKAFDNQTYGVIEDAVDALNSKVWAEGNVTGIVGDQTFGLLLYSIFGTLSTHAVHGFESTVYDNIFNVAETAQHQSISFSVHDVASGQDYQHANGVVTKLELNVQLKQMIQYTATIKALKGTTHAAFTPATTTENHFVPQYVSLQTAGNYAGLRGAFYGTATASSTANVTAVSGFNCNDLTIGMTVVGTNIPGGTTVLAIVSATAFTLSQATTGVGADFCIGFQVATATASSTTAVTALSINTALLNVGQTVFGKFIPVGATITAIGSSSAFTLSAATSGAANNISFGPAVVAVKSAKLTIDQNTEDQEVVGNVAPADFLNKEFHVEGTIECIWQNESDFKTAFMANHVQAMGILIKNTDVTIGTAANPALLLQMARCFILEVSRPLKLKDLIYQTIKFRATYSASDSVMLKATFTNTVNGY